MRNVRVNIHFKVCFFFVNFFGWKGQWWRGKGRPNFATDIQRLGQGRADRLTAREGSGQGVCVCVCVRNRDGNESRSKLSALKLRVMFEECVSRRHANVDIAF